MATPPVPPRPAEFYDPQGKASAPAPPPVPPLPPTFRQDQVQSPSFSSPPHFEDPLVAPRPHKLQPDLSANMARSLHDQVATAPPPGAGTEAYPPQQQYSHSMNLTPGFSMPQQNRPLTVSPGPLPPPQGADWSPWATPQGYPSPYPPPAQQYPPPPQPYPPNQYPPQPYQPTQREDSAVTNAFAALSVGSPAQQPPHTRTSSSGYSAGFPQAQYTVSPNISPPQATRTSSLPYPNYPTQPQLPPAASSKPPTPPQSSGGAPSLTAPLPTISALTAALPSIQQPTTDPSRKVTWAKDVLSLVDRAHHQTSAAAANAPNVDSTNVPIGPVRIGDQQLQRLVDIAVPLILQISNTPQVPPNPLPPYVVEAIYLRATCEASGAYPQIVPHNPRVAFRDFEQAAKAGYYQAWFRLGRDYEAFGDISHAKDCFERGVKYGVESCYYRLGMAYLMGQLGLAPSTEAALPFLQRAATLATIEVPQPAYVYGLLLLNDFTHIQIPPHLFAPLIPPSSSAPAEARIHLERAAYLNFSPALYKLGHSYEFATPPFPFDALLSVQYYSLASQGGEVEADMALSKWFLCGAEGAFEKDEGLAWTFAEKAAKRGLAAAEFAMGYYAEVGVGGPKDIESARRWYTRASQHGNSDASERLQALSQPSPQSLSRQQHETLTDSTLVRKRTQAKQRAEAGGRHAVGSSSANAPRIVENVRKGSVMIPPVASGGIGLVGGGGYGAPQTGSPSSMPGRLPMVDESRTHSPHHSPHHSQQHQQHQHSTHSSPKGRPSPLPSSNQPFTNSTSPRVRPLQVNGGGSPQPQPQQQQQQQHLQKPFANAQRYSLVDPGSGGGGEAGSPKPQQHSGTPPPGRRTPQQQQQQQAPTVGGGQPQQQEIPQLGYGGGPAGRPSKGPQTFAEMGIQSTKLENKDCVIM